MSGSQLKVPIVMRAPNGSARQVASAARRMRWSISTRISRPARARPAMPADAKGLLRDGHHDDDPVLFMESETLYNVKGRVPDDPDYLVPMGLASRGPRGHGRDDHRLQRMVHVALDAANQLAEGGVNAEVIDLRAAPPAR
ncbi:MAG: hypothetical protein U0359_14710 [Byssovorax sp.]